MLFAEGFFVVELSSQCDFCGVGVHAREREVFLVFSVHMDRNRWVSSRDICI